MTTLKIGMFPGELKEFAIEESTTVADALKMANITIGAEQEIKLDGEVVIGSDFVTEDSRLLLVTKRLKGAVR